MVMNEDGGNNNKGNFLCLIGSMSFPSHLIENNQKHKMNLRNKCCHVSIAACTMYKRKWLVMSQKCIMMVALMMVGMQWNTSSNGSNAWKSDWPSAMTRFTRNFNDPTSTIWPTKSLSLPDDEAVVVVVVVGPALKYPIADFSKSLILLVFLLSAAVCVLCFLLHFVFG